MDSGKGGIRGGKGKRLIFWASVLAVVFIDQAAKILARGHLDVRPVEVLPGFFNLCLVYNEGAAWGMLPGMRWFFVLIAVSMLFWLARWGREAFRGGKAADAAFALLSGGIAGNLIDRVLSGKVTDFIDLWHGSYHFPCFNVADACICIGVGLLLCGAKGASHEKPAGDGAKKEADE